MNLSIPRTFVLLATASLALASSAQNLASFGLKAAISQSTEKVWDESFGIRPVGWAAGGYFRVMPKENLGMQAEVLFSAQAASKVTFEDRALVGTLRLHYVQVPVMLVYREGPIEGQVGVYAGRLLSSRMLHQEALSQSGGPLSKEKLSQKDYGLVLGLAYNMERWQFGLRYTYGFCYVIDDNFLDRNWNQQAQLSVGYAILQ